MRISTRSTDSSRRLRAWCIPLVCAATLSAVGAASAATGLISTIAGTGVAGFSGNPGPATASQLSGPTDVEAAPGGGYLFADQINDRIRRVSPTGVVTTVAGDGVRGSQGSGVPATSASLNLPAGIALTPDGGFLIADTFNNLVRKVSASGTITTVAGTGTAGYNGDGIAATAAQIFRPQDIAVTPDGGFLIADTNNHRVRKVSPLGTITTVAGNGGQGYNGEGIDALTALMGFPGGVSLLPDGGFLVTEIPGVVPATPGEGNRVRRVTPDGKINTVAGIGVKSFSGDGGPATAAGLNEPFKVVALAAGGFLVADTFNSRIRKVDAVGVITTVAGNGTEGYSGDGGPPAAAALNRPTGMGVATDGDYLIADANNNVIRAIDLGDSRCALVKRGSKRNDILRGTSGSDRILGLAGNDRLFGRNGDDCLDGGVGDDQLSGGNGDDELTGAAGKDSLTGGAGKDTLRGGPGRDTLTGGPGLDAMTAGPGDDTVNSRDGIKETVNCGAGRDTANIDRRDVAIGCENVRRR